MKLRLTFWRQELSRTRPSAAGPVNLGCSSSNALSSSVDFVICWETDHSLLHTRSTDLALPFQGINSPTKTFLPPAQLFAGRLSPRPASICLCLVTSRVDFSHCSTMAAAAIAGKPARIIFILAAAGSCRLIYDVLVAQHFCQRKHYARFYAGAV